MDFNKALFGFIRVAFSIMIALLVLFAGIKICSICYDFGYRVFTEPAMTTAMVRMFSFRWKRASPQRSLDSF